MQLEQNSCCGSIKYLHYPSWAVIGKHGGGGVVGGDPVGWKCFNKTRPWLGYGYLMKPHSRLQVLLLIKLTFVSMIASCFRIHFSLY